MDIAILDYESYWDTDHSLSKMNPIEYVMHPETEIISLSAKFIRDGKAGETQVIFGEDSIRSVVNRIDWSNMWVIAHNNEGFDSMISAWRMGIKPKMWGCTLAMARPHHAKSAGGSLKALVQHYGLGEKDNTILMQTKGRHLKDFSPEEIEAMGVYNKMDVDQCYGLFRRLIKVTPKDELRLIDMTIRMLVEPQFEVDTALVSAALEEEKTRKARILLDVATMVGAYEPGMTDEEAARAAAKVLGSSPKFSQLLRDLNVPVPTKISPTTGKEAPALAKTDEAFIALTNHRDPIVAAAASARLGVKSTILETRLQAFLAAAGAAGGKLPVPLKYYGADTTGRWSGWGYNPQNLSRVNPKEPKPSDVLRNSLRAPKGYKVVVADLSGIELRVNMFLWKVPYAMALFQEDPEADLYKPMASEVLMIPLEKITKMQRQTGKAMHLGCGFGLGTPDKYVAVAKQMAQIDVTLEDSVMHIAGYRRKHPEIVRGWKTCHDNLTLMRDLAEGDVGYPYPIDPWGMCRPTHHGIITPKGMIRYPDLRQEKTDEGKTEWVYGQGRHKTRIYAGKIDENIVQHLARCVIADNALAVKKETGYNPALMVHDELVYVVPEGESEGLLATVHRIMRTPPAWWPELVTWSEGDIADTYGAAK